MKDEQRKQINKSSRRQVKELDKEIVRKRYNIYTFIKYFEFAKFIFVFINIKFIAPVNPYLSIALSIISYCTSIVAIAAGDGAVAGAGAIAMAIVIVGAVAVAMAIVIVGAVAIAAGDGAVAVAIVIVGAIAIAIAGAVAEEDNY
jgi:hypothetical protein